MNRTLKIVETIEKNPGIKFREMMRVTGMKNGVLSHYINKLEEQGAISVQREPRLTKFFPLGVDKKESLLISNLRQETPKNILLSLLAQDQLTFKEIVERVKRSESTVSINLTKLVQDEIIVSKFLYLKRTFEIKNRDLVQKTINKYHPNLLDRSADHLADIFTSL